MSLTGRSRGGRSVGYCACACGDEGEGGQSRGTESARKEKLKENPLWLNLPNTFSSTSSKNLKTRVAWLVLVCQGLSTAWSGWSFFRRDRATPSRHSIPVPKVRYGHNLWRHLCHGNQQPQGIEPDSVSEGGGPRGGSWASSLYDHRYIHFLAAEGEPLPSMTTVISTRSPSRGTVHPMRASSGLLAFSGGPQQNRRAGW